MLEQLADYDDELMEQLLSDVQPPRDKVFDDLVKELQEGLIVPVLLGSAENGNGILRLLKALRHEAPFVDRTARRLKLENAKSAAHVLKTIYTPHGGKLSASCACWPASSATARSCRAPGPRSAPRGLLAARARTPRSAAPPRPARRWRSAGWRRSITGETLSAEKGGSTQVKAPEPPRAGLRRRHRRQGPQGRGEAHGALAKLMEEDPSLRLEHAKDTHQMVLWGQGEMHLRVALERLKRKYGVDAERQAAASCPTRRRSARASRSAAGTRSSRAATASSATSCSTSSRCRAARGFQFAEKITGGVVPRQFIPSVEIGVQRLPAARAARRSRWSTWR